MFLVENLPKESSESASEPLGKFLSILTLSESKRSQGHHGEESILCMKI